LWTPRSGARRSEDGVLLPGAHLLSISNPLYLRLEGDYDVTNTPRPPHRKSLPRARDGVSEQVETRSAGSILLRRAKPQAPCRGCFVRSQARQRCSRRSRSAPREACVARRLASRSANGAPAAEARAIRPRTAKFGGVAEVSTACEEGAARLSEHPDRWSREDRARRAAAGALKARRSWACLAWPGAIRLCRRSHPVRPSRA